MDNQKDKGQVEYRKVQALIGEHSLFCWSNLVREYMLTGLGLVFSVFEPTDPPISYDFHTYQEAEAAIGDVFLWIIIETESILH